MARRNTVLDLNNTNRMFAETGISYAIIGTDLNVVAATGDFPGSLIKPDMVEHCSLLDIAPELIGAENELEEIIAGKLARLHIPMVNRENKQGEVLYCNLTVLPHLDTKQAIDGLIFVTDDITSMALIEQAVTQHRNELTLLRDQLARKNMQMTAANAELRRLDELKSRFVSIAAHELRSPLATISGYLDLLSDEDFGELSSQQRDFVAAIQRSSIRLLETIEKLLDLTHIASGRMDIVLSLYDLDELLELAIVEVQPLVKAKNQRLLVTLDVKLPQIFCDRDRTAQVLHNMLSNAVKYTPEGGNIKLAAARSSSPGYLQISVIDEGIGIPPDDHDNIFETFFRASNVHQAGASGSGLGLNITRSLVELHGGEIWFESEVGVGTTFHTTFPAADNPTD